MPLAEDDAAVIPALLRAARGAYSAAIANELHADGIDDLPRNGPFVLGGMANHGGLLRDLIRELRVSKQAASQLVDSLVLRGFLERHIDAVDRRRLAVELTPRGQAAAAAVRRGVESVDDELARRIAPVELAGLKAGLSALADIAGARSRSDGAMRTVAATRYVTPLREGGSLPALVEADDDGLYVLKFRGAGQGPKALVAEVVAGELARALGLPVPELVARRARPGARARRARPRDPGPARSRARVSNLGVDFLPGALTFSPAAGPAPDPEFAADVVWFDALVTNVDRTPQNPNLLCWHGRLWLIDHGAALYWHHAPTPADGRERARVPADPRPRAAAVRRLDRRRRRAAGAQGDRASSLDEVVDQRARRLARRRRARRCTSTTCARRLEAPRGFVEEAERARG